MDSIVPQVGYLMCAVAVDAASSSDEAIVNLKRLLAWREGFSEFANAFLSKPGLTLGRNTQATPWQCSLVAAVKEFPLLNNCEAGALSKSVKNFLPDGTVTLVRSLLLNFVADEDKRGHALSNAEVKLFRVHIDIPRPLCLIQFSFPPSMCTSSCLCVLFSFSFPFFFSFLFLVAPEVVLLSILKCGLEVRGVFFPYLS